MEFVKFSKEQKSLLMMEYLPLAADVALRLDISEGPSEDSADIGYGLNAKQQGSRDRTSVYCEV